MNRVSKPVLLVIAMALYAVLLSSFGHAKWFSPPVDRLSLTFNSMLDHLLRGRFDVDPGIVGLEGFVVDGRVIAYWGPLLALFRLPLAPTSALLRIDVTALSCLVAVCLMAWAKLATAEWIFKAAAAPRRGIVYWGVLLTILFGGPQIEFLRVNVYQEVCLWAGAFGALFVYGAIRGIGSGSFSVRSLCGMAFVAGLALLTRVSVAIGLYAALGLLLIVLAPRGLRRVWGPVAILSVFAAVAGFVNDERWGSPLVFADYHRYLYNFAHPGRILPMLNYGPFNLARVPFGIGYYLVPMWVLQRPDGKLLFEELQLRLTDFTELPPSSFLLTDGLLILLALYALRELARPATAAHGSRGMALAVAAGLAIPGLLMLSAVSMSFRYRIDFYPLLELLAFLGLFALLRRGVALRPAVGRMWVGLTAFGIVASFGMLGVYKISALGPAVHALRPGLIGYYAERIAGYRRSPRQP